MHVLIATISINISVVLVIVSIVVIDLTRWSSYSYLILVVRYSGDLITVYRQNQIRVQKPPCKVSITTINTINTTLILILIVASNMCMASLITG